MNANELRIGNWIYEPECEPHYFQIEELRKFVGSEIWAYYRKGSIKVKEPFPIPLTEEILLKCGFELSYKGLHTTYEINEGIVTYYFWDDRQYASFKGADIKCEYLHTLQNLIFILTNTELNITL